MKKLILILAVVFLLGCEKESTPQVEGETHLNFFYVDEVVEMETGQAYKVKFSNGSDWFYLYDRDGSMGFKEDDILKLNKKN